MRILFNYESGDRSLYPSDFQQTLFGLVGGLGLGVNKTDASVGVADSNFVYVVVIVAEVQHDLGFVGVESVLHFR